MIKIAIYVYINSAHKPSSRRSLRLPRCEGKPGTCSTKQAAGSQWLGSKAASQAKPCPLPCSRERTHLCNYQGHWGQSPASHLFAKPNGSSNAYGSDLALPVFGSVGPLDCRRARPAASSVATGTKGGLEAASRLPVSTALVP